jgi:hypothetical protein
MRVPDFLVRGLTKWAHHYMRHHPYSQAITDEAEVCVLIYRYDILDLPGFHVRLHDIRCSDVMRDPHDHPWWNCTVVCDGAYNEVVNHPHFTYDWVRRRRAGDVVFRRALDRHRIVLDDTTPRHWGKFMPRRYAPAVTLFIHGRNKRCWGFWNEDGSFRAAPNQRRTPR